MPKKVTTEDFIKRAKEKHGDKYDYSKIEYINSDTYVTVVCPKHGEFKQSPMTHLSGCGCLQCGGTATFTTEDFIKRAREKHGDKYDYSKVDYINSNTPVVITCSFK